MCAARLLVIQHIPEDHLHELAAPLSDAQLVIETWFTPGRPAPTRDIAEYDGVLSLGALEGVNDEPDHPWISTERKLLERAMTAGIPTLGICFGSQLLASIGGATVRHNESQEFGWTRLDMDPIALDDPVLSALGPDPFVFSYHHDTFGPPPAGELLGRSPRANQVLRIGESTWGMQFHIEAGAGAILSWLATFEDDFRVHGIDPAAVAAETSTRWLDYRALAVEVGNAFGRAVNTFASHK
jgi:GMP synthase (glutamine-hydrolysing)